MATNNQVSSLMLGTGGLLHIHDIAHESDDDRNITSTRLDESLITLALELDV